MLRRMTGWAIGAVLATASAAPAATLNADAAGAIVTARQEIQAAVNTLSASDLLDARASLLALSEDEQASAPAQYTLAYLDWRLAPLWLREHADRTAEAAQFVDEGLAAAHAVQKASPKDGEAWAFESSLLGIQMMMGGGDMMTLGPLSMQAMGKAAKLGPTNPRVLLMQGISQLYTPEQFGGGAALALATLLEAETALQADVPADSLSPAWGHDDVHTWLGQVYLRLGRADAAAAELQQALALNPASTHAKTLQRALPAQKPADAIAPAPAGGK